MRRTPPSSDTYREPASASIPKGLLRAAAAPTPSVVAATPLPASVVTTAPVSFRMRLFRQSAMKKTLLTLTIPRGKLKLAERPTPSAHLPA